MSIDGWKRLYQSDRHVLCYNQISPVALSDFSDLEWIDQEAHLDSLPQRPQKTMWKFCPPRLDVNSHEVFIDNDIVFHNRNQIVSQFFDSNTIFVSAAHRPFWGAYSSLLKPETRCINTGFIGLPPGYDFAQEIRHSQQTHPVQWGDHCDDQGLFALLMSQNSKFRIIPIEEVWAASPKVSFAPYQLGTSATHFASLNDGYLSYWHRFIQESHV
jgi:hypothetical protein